MIASPYQMPQCGHCVNESQIRGMGYITFLEVGFGIELTRDFISFCIVFSSVELASGRFRRVKRWVKRRPRNIGIVADTKSKEIYERTEVYADI